MGQEHFTERVPYHESRMQWWGTVVAWSSYRDHWMTEAIVEMISHALAPDTKKKTLPYPARLAGALKNLASQLLKKLTGHQRGPWGLAL